jgi:peptidyl-prolyl cis-trans isomerase D
LIFGPPVDLTRNQPAPGMAPDALVRIFQVDAKKLPGYVGNANERGGYSIYRVSGVINPAALDDARIKLVNTRLGDQLGRELMMSYLGSLRAKADVKINQANLEKKQQ